MVPPIGCVWLIDGQRPGVGAQRRQKRSPPPVPVCWIDTAREHTHTHHYESKYIDLTLDAFTRNLPSRNYHYATFVMLLTTTNKHHPHGIHNKKTCHDYLKRKHIMWRMMSHNATNKTYFTPSRETPLRSCDSHFDRTSVNAHTHACTQPKPMHSQCALNAHTHTEVKTNTELDMLHTAWHNAACGACVCMCVCAHARR